MSTSDETVKDYNFRNYQNLDLYNKISKFCMQYL